MNEQAEQDRQIVTLGYISGVHGIRGWVKVHSYTEPTEAVLKYQPWILDEGASTRVLIYAGRLIREGVPARRACQVSVTWGITDDAQVQRSIDEVVSSIFP